MRIATECPNTLVRQWIKLIFSSGQWESDDNYGYEFYNGVLEPTTSMKQDGDYLLTNLENCFFKLDAFKFGDRLRLRWMCG